MNRPLHFPSQVLHVPAAVIERHQLFQQTLIASTEELPHMRIDPFRPWDSIIKVLHPSYSIDIYPQTTEQFISWIVPSAGVSPFDANTDLAIVYLRLPRMSRKHTSDITLEDNVYWICGDVVLAAAGVEKVLHSDIVVQEDCLVVPVIVRKFDHDFKPFLTSDAVAFFRKTMKSELADVPPTRPPGDGVAMSVLAREVSEDLGLALLIYTEDDSRVV